MTHKQRCIAYCKQYLQQLSLDNIFSLATFNHYYRKHNGSTGNAYLVGLHAADLIINSTNLKTQEV